MKHRSSYQLLTNFQPRDEANLDRWERVPIFYTKELLQVEFWAVDSSSVTTVESTRSVLDHNPIDVGNLPANETVMVYVDRLRMKECEPREEYIYRVNKGIDDAVALGVPTDYVERVLRKAIPKEPGKNFK